MSNQEQPSRKVIAIKKMSSVQLQKDTPNEGAKSHEQASSALERSKLRQEITDLTQQKENMLKDLRQSIKQEKENWSKKKEEERQAAREIGHQEGYQSGEKEAETAWKNTLERANQLVDQAKEDYYRTIEKHEEAIIELAIASAEKILHVQLEKEEALTSIISEAITELQNGAYIHIYIHPDEYERVMKQKLEMEQIVGTKDLISIYMDPEMSPYDCIIKHPNGQIDASIDSQLRQIKNALFEKVMEES